VFVAQRREVAFGVQGGLAAAGGGGDGLAVCGRRRHGIYAGGLDALLRTVTAA
jgi:hypothetical protein